MSSGQASDSGSRAAPAAPAALSATPNGTIARPEQPPAYSRADLLEDFDRFANVLLTRNPLAFADKAELAQFIRQQREVLRDGMSQLDFYRILTPIVVKVRCGHTGIFLSPAEETRLRSSQRYFPVLVRIAAGRLFVISPLGSEELQPGSEIFAINGRPSAEIIARMYDNITADGANVTRKTYVASRVFNDLYSLFIDDGPDFRVEYHDAGRGVSGTVELKGISKATLEREAAGAGFPYGLPEQGPAYSFSTSSSGRSEAAVLTIRTFLYLAGRLDYEAFIDRCFATLAEQKTRALILDLRGNWGGDPEASAYVFARLIRTPARYFEEGTPLYGALTKPILPAPNAFTGTLLVLTDGACFSSTGHLCSLLRFHGRGLFVGEETGGSWTTTDSSQDYPLPRTGMRLHSSNGAFRTAVTGLPLGRGIMPDGEAATEIGDLLARRDLPMELAVSMIPAEED
jgi:C-terminal processing protease CtpA/Prc